MNKSFGVLTCGLVLLGLMIALGKRNPGADCLAPKILSGKRNGLRRLMPSSGTSRGAWNPKRDGP